MKIDWFWTFQSLFKCWNQFCGHNSDSDFGSKKSSKILFKYHFKWNLAWGWLARMSLLSIEPFPSHPIPGAIQSKRVCHLIEIGSFSDPLLFKMPVSLSWHNSLNPPTSFMIAPTAFNYWTLLFFVFENTYYENTFLSYFFQSSI